MAGAHRDDVVQRIVADALRARRGAGEVLDEVGKDKDRALGRSLAAKAGADLVDAGAVQLDDHVAEIVDDIDVVAAAARHRVGARAAVDQIVVAVAGQRLVGRAAGEVLDIGEAGDAEGGEVGADLVEALRHRPR